MSFAAMKNNRQKNLDKLTSELTKLNQGPARDDEGFWMVHREVSNHSW